MMAQFMMDVKAEHRISPSLYSPASPKMTSLDSGRPQSTDSGVLDLSKRRDSLDTRKTPSPYNSFSEGGSPASLHCSPLDPSRGMVLNYSHLPQRSSPRKSCGPRYDDHPDHRPVYQVVPPYHPLLSKALQQPMTHEHLLHDQRTVLPPYVLPVGVPSPHYPPSPHPALRESDTASESGSESPRITSTQKRPEPASKQPGGPAVYPMVVGRDGKLSRPFKAYPRDPLSLAAGFVASDTILDTNSTEKYNLFRKRMLEQIHAANGGHPTISNPKMRRLNNGNGNHGSGGSSSKSIATSDASSETESLPNEKPPPPYAIALHVPENLTTVDGPTAANQRSPDRHRLPMAATAPATKAEPLTSPVPSPLPAGEPHNSGSIDVAAADDDSGTERGPHGANGAGNAIKDSAYYERRKKNNAAAKKSRDRRRIKEDEIAIRAAFLERENIELKLELAAARKQLALYGVTGGSP